MSPAEGRKFGLSVGAAFLLIGSVIWWRGHATVASACGLLGALLVMAGLILPGRLGPIYRGWMGFALLLSRITTPIFMAVTYFLVIGPVALIMRLMGRNPLVRTEGDGSFWVPRPEGRERRSDLNRQF